MLYKSKFLFVLFLLAGCSGMSKKLDTPKDLDQKKIERDGKLFGDLEYRFPSGESEKEKKKEHDQQDKKNDQREKTQK